MFLVSELLFGFVYNFFVGFFNEKYFSLAESLAPKNFFSNHPGYLLISALIELIGVMFLFFYDIKSSSHKYKLLTSLLLIMSFFILIYSFLMGYAISHLQIL